MQKRTINIITPRKQPHKVCAMGNEAIVRGAVESGVDGVFSYPGTPSTEISEIFNHIYNFQHEVQNQIDFPELTTEKIYFEYSINEKIALEKAIAFSVGNKSALCVMKNVGMNVASDPLMSVTYQTIGAPLVIIVCDDPGCHSSSNEQDSRYWGPMASVPVFNPANPHEAYEMTRMAFQLSAQIKLPVIVRTTTRVSHTRGNLFYHDFTPVHRDPKFERLPEHINIPARTSAAHARLLDKLASEPVKNLLTTNCKLLFDNAQADSAIITSGVSAEYLKELIFENNLQNQFNVLNVGIVHPFAEQDVLKFLQRGFKKILILEELDAFIETKVRTLVQENKLPVEILGKGFSRLLPTGEFSIDILRDVLQDFSEGKVQFKKNIPLDHAAQMVENLPPRPPALCSGCPHRATFYLLKLAVTREQGELIMCGDIGCFGLGALPPLKMIDTVNHMGMSISMAQGLYESFHGTEKEKKVAALLGDGTFFHSGLTSLVNAVYTRANILVVIFDNRTTGMTGHQDHPGASRLSRYHEIEIEPLLKGMGIEVVENINPFNITDSFEKLNRAMAHKGVSVLISKAPCIFLPDYKEKVEKNLRIYIDPNKCNTCANHEDKSLACSRCYSPLSNLSRAKAKFTAEVSISGLTQSCPANICNHGFFNSIREGHYKDAVEIVRDKMLFSKTCGDICHRPCELFSGQANPVPIKYLKKVVSGIDEIFDDFSAPIKRVENAKQKNKKVAVVGSGPAGLSSAYDLVQQGYTVTIFEKEQKAGGMISHVIPKFRMNKDSYLFEAMQLEKMGVSFRFGMRIGTDITLDQLSKEFDAVILATGLSKSKSLKNIQDAIPPNQQEDAISFLKKYNEDQITFVENSTVFILGGGNSAIDSARAAKRCGKNIQVVLACLETEEKMPAFDEEILHAKAEGIIIYAGTKIQTLNLNSSQKIEIDLYDAETGNQKIQSVNTDYLITAIGQEADHNDFIKVSLRCDEKGRVMKMTSEEHRDNIFIAGDVQSGNHMSLIGAIGSGKLAAVEVRHLLENYLFPYEGQKALNNLNTSTLNLKKQSMHSTMDGLIDFEKYNLHQPCQKCNHCIDNFGCPAMVKINGKVQIDQSRCTLCGLCIDVCPNGAIQWVEASQITNSTMA
ncbi:MAG: FAD-dependent oxidoreductase [Crocinitomicaceae bacterium]|nr:FAD-dependent oxidoreductase [Crocinitomicaceae bacterium]